MIAILNMCAQPTAEYMLGRTKAPDLYHNCLGKSSKKYELTEAIRELYPTNTILQRAVLEMPMSNFSQELENIRPRVDTNDILSYTKKKMINTLMKEIEEKQDNYFYLNDDLSKSACDSVALSFRLYSLG